MKIKKPKKQKHLRLTPQEKDRYYAEILADCKQVGDCLIYQGKKNAKGYGVKKFGDRTHTVSRFMLAYATRESLSTLDNHDFALHKSYCISRACCHADHLYWGTHSQNSYDRWADDRKREPLRLWQPEGEYLPLAECKMGGIGGIGGIAVRDCATCTTCIVG